MSTIQTQKSSLIANRDKRVSEKRLWLAGLSATVINTIGNSTVRNIALAKLPIPAHNMQLSTPVFVIVFTIVATLAATATFALINRSARRPIPTFRIVATIVLVLTFIPDFLILAMPHENLSVTVTLLIMHTASYLLCVALLTGVAPSK